MLTFNEIKWLLFLCFLAALILAILHYTPTFENKNHRESEIPTQTEVENDIAFIIEIIPDSDYKNEALQAFTSYRNGQPVSREFLLKTIKLFINPDISDDTPTQDLIDMLAQAYAHAQ